MILVTGATGSIGRELISELDAKGAEFRILVRDPASAAALPEGALRFTGDLSDPATLTPAFDGADKLFLLTPDIGIDHAAYAVAAARAVGMRHIVHLSSIRVLSDPLPAIGRGPPPARGDHPRFRHPRHVPAARRFHDLRLQLAAHHPRGRVCHRPARSGPLRADRSRRYRRGRRAGPDRRWPSGQGLRPHGR